MVERHVLIMVDWAREIADLFEAELFGLPSTNDLFNMYRDRVSNGRDVEDAPVIRRRNLISYLSAYPKRPAALLMIEAPGPWGCRFSGVPITSELQLLDPEIGRASCRERVLVAVGG